MKKEGLILEGGAIRGVFTAGVLDVLMEEDFKFPYVIGVSAGACNAVDYVSEQPGRTRDCMIIKEKEYQYVNVRKILKNRSLFDMDMIFDRFPNEIFPFDYRKYFSSETECELVVTNCQTGKAEYIRERKDKDRLLRVCRASSSIPLFSPIVTIDEKPYLDGGLADSIPILRALKTGHTKNVIVLTRNYGYRKKIKNRTKQIFSTFYREYPELVRTICNRASMYNRTLSYIEKWEKEGRVFVIRPEIPAVSRTEQDYEVLTEFYEHGREQMLRNFSAMKDFLKQS